MGFLTQPPRQPDPLELAFCEYAIHNWDEADWTIFGRETGTGDILRNDARLYRSLSFGDDDYDDCVYRVVPQVLREALGAEDSPGERMQLIADYAPKMLPWMQDHGTRRAKRNLLGYLREYQDAAPSEWQDMLGALEGALDTPPTLSNQHSPQTQQDHKGQVRNEESHESSSSNSYNMHPRPHSGLATRVIGITPSAPFIHGSGGQSPMNPTKQIFIVHGRDNVAVDKVKLFVHNVTKIMPKTLADTPGQGDTIIEKFERESASVAYAIVLLTADDEGRLRVDSGSNAPALQPRARQNVVLELGYFFGKLGRKKVTVLNAGVEQPSDVHGLQYISYPGPEWKEELRRELEAAGLVSTVY